MSAVVMTTPAAGAYRLIQTISVAGDEGWDHPTIDSAARRLYVTHGTHVVVIDIESGKLVGKIDDTPGVHFTVIDPELGRGFISNGGAAGRLTIFDTKTLATIGQVATGGENPGPTVFVPARKRIFTFNLNTHNAAVVDAKEGHVVGSFELGGRPELVGADAHGSVFVNLVEKNVVLQIDSHKMTVGQTWSVGPCQGPRTMAVDQQNRRLFVGCANRRMIVLDSQSGRIIDSGQSAQVRMIPLTIRRHGSYIFPTAMARFPSSSRKTRTLTTLSKTVKTALGARNMALDPKTKRIFLPLFDRRAPPPATAAASNRPGDVIPGTFRVLVFGK